MTTFKTDFSPSRVALFAALSAGLLATGKLLLFFFSGSLVIALSAWDSCMDVLVSLINRKIVIFARSDADDEHPYGHGRAESIGALGQGSLITGGALIVFGSAVKELWNIYFLQQKSPLFTNFHTLYFFFFMVCAIISFLITKMLGHFGKKFHSPALLADSKHYHVDFLTNIFTGGSLLVIHFLNAPVLDPILALFFAAYIAYGGSQLITESIHELMDRDIPDDIKNDVIAMVHELAPDLLDIHNFRGRKSGHRYFFDFHITLPTHFSFLEVHDIIDGIEEAINKKYNGGVVVHPDPHIVRRCTKK